MNHWLKNIIEKQNISEYIDIVAYKSKVNNIDLVQGVDFLLYRTLLQEETKLIKVRIIDGVQNKEEAPPKLVPFSDKIKGDYDPSRFYKAVAIQNAKNGCSDLDSIINKSLIAFKSLPDYEFTNTLDLYSSIGKAYFENGNIEMAKKNFDIIFSSDLNIDCKTLAKEHKVIGKLFEPSDLKYALKWYKKAMEYNPNIGLKGTITKLEN